METNLATQERHLPSLEDLYGDIELKQKENQLNILLNQPPSEKWLKFHPMAKGPGGAAIKYIPIERIEWLLTRIFVRWNVEVREVKQIANSVVVTVRLYYTDPLTDQQLWQDGVGAAPLQTNQGAGAIDWNQIKAAAVQIAAPAAESYAIKDAAEKIGKLFGKDLNRADQIGYDNLANNLVMDSPASTGLISLISSLMRTSTIDHDQRETYENMLPDMSTAEAMKLLKYVRDNQQDPVTDRGVTDQTDILVKTAEILRIPGM